ncbi:MAG: exo-alpha-sialidase [Verrucomicrobia bacterium]|nr:exo-alpha-sialidase [Verrucomicrobiota bacterium]
MQFKKLSEGFVSQRQPNTPTAVAAGSRCALAPGGEIVCTYMVQSKLGINDFKPMLSRSADGGKTWRDQGLIWPRLAEQWAIFGSISRSPSGDLFFFGARTVINQPGETFWSDATQGMKQNELFWAKSTDGGVTWTDPVEIPMPIPGSAEAPGAMCITRSGRWIGCYAPYNTFDPKVTVDRNQIVAVRSDDRGKTWKHNPMIRFPDLHSTGAEAWLIQLSDGRLLGTTWHLNQKDHSDHPNAFAISSDEGTTWTPMRSTGIMGQSTALAALPDGKALFLYNQRKHAKPGIWLAVVKPTETDFGVEANEIVWQAETRTQSGTTGEHSQWQDFSFGEPSVTILPDRTLLVTLWCVQPSGQGIRYAKLRMTS